MKKTLLVTVGILAVLNSAFADESKKPQERMVSEILITEKSKPWQLELADDITIKKDRFNSITSSCWINKTYTDEDIHLTQGQKVTLSQTIINERDDLQRDTEGREISRKGITELDLVTDNDENFILTCNGKDLTQKQLYKKLNENDLGFMRARNDNPQVDDSISKEEYEELHEESSL